MHAGGAGIDSLRSCGRVYFVASGIGEILVEKYAAHTVSHDLLGQTTVMKSLKSPGYLTARVGRSYHHVGAGRYRLPALNSQSPLHIEGIGKHKTSKT